MREYQVDIPEGKSGDWEVRKFTVGEKDHLSQAIGAMKSGRYVPDGTYTGLYRKGVIIMSDTPDEYRDHGHFIYQAQGNVLVVGLGIGMVTKCLLAKPDVISVTVIEKSEDVIKLVAPTYQASPKFHLVHADVFEYKPEKGTVFDWGWFDIWDNLCTDNLKEMTTLKRKFRSCKNKGCWGEELLRYRKRQEDRRARMWGY